MSNSNAVGVIILSIAFGLVTWFLDRSDLPVPRLLITVIGCVVIGGITYGLFYPLLATFSRMPWFRDGSTSSSIAGASALLCVFTTMAISWWIFRPGEMSREVPSDTVKTELRLRFFGDSRLPENIYSENIYWRYALWHPGATVPTGKTASEPVFSKTWNIFIVFKKPIRYEELGVSFSGAGLPQYEITATDRSAIVSFLDDIPAGTLRVYAKR